MGFRLVGLPGAQFAELAALSDAELRNRNMVRVRAEPGFPCRVTLRDVEPGESALLLHYYHHDAPSPYRASGPIFVTEGRHEAAVFTDTIPPEMRGRLYSARAYDAEGFMVEGDTAPGDQLEELLNCLLDADGVEYVHLHHARRGCFACKVERV